MIAPNPRGELIERADLIDKTVSWLLGSSTSGQAPGVLFVGRPGAGTTAVAMAVAERLRAESARTSTGENNAASGDPLIIHDVHRHPDDEVLAAFTAAGADGRPIILTAREGVDLPVTVARRWSEGSLWRADVRPLTEQGVGDLVEQILGARPALNLVRPLHILTEGLPLYLREAISELGDRGEASLIDGVWVRSVPYLTPGPRLVALVRQRVAMRASGCRKALEMIAVAGTLRVALATQLCDPLDLEAAESTGLLRLTADNEFTIVPPMVGEAIERSLSVVGRAAHRRRLLDEVDEAKAPAAMVIRMGQWLLEDRDMSRTSLLVRASELAASTGELAVSGRLAKSALEAAATGTGGAPDEILNASYRARARLVAGRAYRFEEALQPTFETLDPLLAPGAEGDALVNKVPARVRALLLVADVQQYTLGEYSQAMSTLDQAAEVKDQASLRLVHVQRLVHDAFAGKVAEVLPALEKLDNDPLSTFPERVLIAGAMILGLTEAGRGDEAVRFGERALHMAFANAAENPVAVAEVASTWMVCRLRTMGPVGWDAARMISELEPSTGRFRYDDGINQLGSGLYLLAQGHAPQALDELLGAISVFRIADPTGFMANALSTAVHAAMCSDRVALAEELATRWYETPTGGSGIVASEMDNDLLWYRYAKGGSSEVAEIGQPLVQRHEDQGMWGAAVRTRHTMLRLGVSSAIEDADHLARRVRGAHMETMVEHLRGVVTHDGERLFGAAEAFERQGASLLGAECAAQAGDAFREQGKPAAARRAAGLVRDLRAQIGAVATPILGGWAGPVGLTRREREVAMLVVEDMSSAEVGEELGISSRTVEAHLQRVYDKLGVNRRADLTLELINRA
ncbi:MAG TPA: LuxR C-terminal-related transcriptional regulator [Ilumatobacteraceae bacterium]|nr:LuxR C-terminal-related transcriptional regulator [Ilumatobacteraceae bacterium]